MGNHPKSWDCIVVGAGPAGLSAALYLARFRRSVLLMHDGTSRTLRIPTTRNVPGFPDGINGTELIRRMSGHCERYGAHLMEVQVAHVESTGAGYRLESATGTLHEARTIVLATGLEMQQLDVPHDMHEAAMYAGVLRYCPICDGNEHANERIAVIGRDLHGASEALFLRHFSAHITLIQHGEAPLATSTREQLACEGIEVITAKVVGYAPTPAVFKMHFDQDPEPRVFDVVYPAYGNRQRNELASMLDIPLDTAGCVDASSPFGTNAPGVFCAGDIVEGLDQISVAMGHGAIAATRAHNWLREMDGSVLRPRA